MYSMVGGWGVGGWVADWVGGKVGERVGNIPVGCLGAPGGISVVPVCLGVLWGEVWLLGLSFETDLSHSTVEMLSRF